MTIACPVCRSHHADDMAICATCGHDLAALHFRVCPSCGALSAADQRRCHRCLELLAPSATAGEDTVNVEATPLDHPEALASTTTLEAIEPASDASVVEPVPDESAPEPPPASNAAIAEPLDAWPPEPVPDPADEPEPDAMPSSAPEAALVSPSDEATLGRSEPPEILPATVAPASLKEALLLDTPLDPLAGIGAPLALARAMTRPHRAVLLPAQPPDEAERFDAELLGRIAAEPPSFAEGAHRLPWQGGVHLPAALRALFYLLVLASAIAPLLFPGLGSAWVQPRPAVRALAEAVAALPADAPALLIWGYDAGYSGEMDPLARALLHDLARREAQVEIIALSPSSLGQAQWLTSQLGLEQVVVRGYVPVSEAGWRLLSDGDLTALLGDGAPTRTLDDYALGLILADSAATARGWIEQVGPYTGLTPFALTTARSETVLLPYLATGQLSGLLGAAWAAPEYEVASGAQPEALLRVGGLAGLALAVILVAVLAMLLGPGRSATAGEQR